MALLANSMVTNGVPLYQHDLSDDLSEGQVNGVRPDDHLYTVSSDGKTTYDATKLLKKPTEASKQRKTQRKSPDGRQSNGDVLSVEREGASSHHSGIRWAPLHIPFQRRLQTLAILIHTLSISLFVSAFFLLCTIPIFWPFLIIYLIYILYSREGVSGQSTRRSQFLRSLPYWSLFASYFPIRLHRSQMLPSTRKYIFGYHPHGIISHGAFAAFATEAVGFSKLFPAITNTLLTLDSNFRIPLYRDYILGLGLASVSRESCENNLKRGGHDGEGMGRAITIVVGGARESLDARPGSMRLVLKHRKGFIKLAVRTGADLVPVLSFGENDLYDQLPSSSHPFIHHLQLLAKKFLGFTVPLFHARGVFNYDIGLLPYRNPVNIVVGRPIKVVGLSSGQSVPDDRYVDQLHAEYIDELQRLWHQWKDVFEPDETSEIEIVE